MEERALKLSVLIEALKTAKLLCEEKDVVVNKDFLMHHLAFDSRKVQTGGCFVAIRGYKTDGHLFFDQAVQNGARVIIIERMPETDLSVSGLSLVYVKDSAKALSIAAQVYYDWPASKLEMIGVTGTNGKTTVSHLISGLLKSLDQKNVLIGTIENKVGDQIIEANMTTPNSIELNRILAAAVEAGCKYGIMEVSSHALEQNRVFGLDFRLAIFTNLSRDHLDYHKNFEDYLLAKQVLFNSLDESAIAIGNADDSSCERMFENCNAKQIALGRDHGEPRISNPEIIDGKMSFAIEGRTLNTELVGAFNSYNLAQCYCTGIALGFDKDTIFRYLSNAKPVPGRFEKMEGRDGLKVIIDYAHTPDALENVLTTAREITRFTEGKLIVVFGCGGDRDKGKRPLMGEVSSRLADQVYLTSDNPRSEDPTQIITDVLKGIDQMDTTEIIEDRRLAIQSAITAAKKNDLVLIAGKGHENYQVLEDRTIDFDDKQISQDALLLR